MAEPEGFNPEDYTMDPQTGELREKTDPVPRKLRRQFDRNAKKLEEAEHELAQLRRQLAVQQAGISTTDPLGELFLRAYNGPDDVDAIKAEAAKYGLIKVDPGQQAQIDQSLAGHQQSMHAAAGSQTQNGGVDHQAALRAIAAKHQGPNASEAAKAEIAQYMQANLGPEALQEFVGRG